MFKILDDLRSSCQQHDRFAVEPPRIQWRLTCLSASSSLGGSVTIVHPLELCRRDVADRLEQPTVVEPVGPFERRELDLVEVLPGTLLADQFGLEEADHRLGESVVIGVAA